MFKKRPICPRCEHKMKVDKDDDEFYICSYCDYSLYIEDYEAGPPYDFEYIKDDGRPIFDESTDRSWLEDL